MSRCEVIPTEPAPYEPLEADIPRRDANAPSTASYAVKNSTSTETSAQETDRDGGLNW